MRRSDYEKYNRRYHYSSNSDERTRTRRGYFTPPRLNRDHENDERSEVYYTESDDYDAHPYFYRKRRIGRHNDRNFLQNIGHNMKQAWDEWAKDDTRVDNPSRDDTYYPNTWRGNGGGYNRGWQHEQRTPPQRVYIYEDYNEPELEYTGYDEPEAEYFGNARHMGMRWRSRSDRGKHPFKYRRRK
jgi:hypothetical protein